MNLETNDDDDDEIEIVATRTPTKANLSTMNIESQSNLDTSAPTTINTIAPTSVSLQLFELPTDKLKRRFKKEVINELKSAIAFFISCEENEEDSHEDIRLIEQKQVELMEIQFKVFQLYMAIYHEAVKGIQYIIAQYQTSGDFHISEPLVWPEELIILSFNSEFETPSSYESYNFIENDALQLCKHELIPEVLEILLKIGNKKNKKKKHPTEKKNHRLSPAVHDTFLYMIFHYVQFMIAMVKLVQVCTTHQDDMYEISSPSILIGTKRERKEMETGVSYSISEYILNFMGNELLQFFGDVLVSDFCITAYSTCTHNLHRGKETNLGDLLICQMPYLYQVLSSGDILDRRRLSDYDMLYKRSQHDDGAVSSDKYIYSILSPKEINAHWLAITRLIVKSAAIESFNSLLQNTLDVSSDLVPISFVYVKLMLRVFISISCLAPFIRIDDDKIDFNEKNETLYRRLSLFRDSLVYSLESFQVRKSVIEAESILEVLDILEQKSMFDLERSIDVHHVVSFFGLTLDELDTIRISILWKMLTGRNDINPSKKSENAPSLQLQLYSIKSLMTWLMRIQGDMILLKNRLRTSPQIIESKISTVENGSIQSMICEKESDFSSSCKSRIKTSLKNSELRLQRLLMLVKSETNDFLSYILSCTQPEILHRGVHLPKLMFLSKTLSESDILKIWYASGMIDDCDGKRHTSITHAVHNMLLELLNIDDCNGQEQDENSRLLEFTVKLFYEYNTDAKCRWTADKLEVLHVTVKRSIQITQNGEKSVRDAFSLAFKVSSGVGCTVSTEMANCAFENLIGTIDEIIKESNCPENQNCTPPFLQRFTFIIEWILSCFHSSSMQERTTAIRLLHRVFDIIPILPYNDDMDDAPKKRSTTYLYEILQGIHVSELIIRETLDYIDAECYHGDDRIGTNPVYTDEDCLMWRKSFLKCYIQKSILIAAEKNIPVSKVLKLSDYCLLDQMWPCLIEYPSDHAGYLLVEYLASLHGVLAVSEGTKRIQTLICKCYSELAGSKSLYPRTKRILRLLVLLINAVFENSGLQKVCGKYQISHSFLERNIFGRNVSSILRKPTPFEITISEVDDRGMQYKIYCSRGSDTQLAEVRNSIEAFHLENQTSPGLDGRLVHQTHELIDNHMTLKALGVDGESTIYMVPPMSTESILFPNGTNRLDKTNTTSFPCEGVNSSAKMHTDLNYLCSTEHIQLILSLMQYGDGDSNESDPGEVNDLCWMLLQRLPCDQVLDVNLKNVFVKGKNICQDSLERMLCSDLYRLNYSLEILERIIYENECFFMRQVSRRIASNSHPRYDGSIEESLSKILFFLLSLLQLLLDRSLSKNLTTEGVLREDRTLTAVICGKIVRVISFTTNYSNCIPYMFQSIEYLLTFLRLVEYSQDIVRTLENGWIATNRSYLPRNDELSEICSALTLDCMCLIHQMSSTTESDEAVPVQKCFGTEDSTAFLQLVHRVIMNTISTSTSDFFRESSILSFSTLLKSCDLSFDVSPFLLCLLRTAKMDAVEDNGAMINFNNVVLLVLSTISALFRFYTNEQRTCIIQLLICHDMNFQNDYLLHQNVDKKIEGFCNLLLYSLAEVMELIRCGKRQNLSTGCVLKCWIYFIEKYLDICNNNDLNVKILEIRCCDERLLVMLAKMCFEIHMMDDQRSYILSFIQKFCNICDSNKNVLISRIHVYINNDSPRYDTLDMWTCDPYDGITSLIGLKNQGNTCYANSLFQQLFYITNYRDRILSLDIPSKIENPRENKIAMIHLVQMMFRTILLSNRRIYDTFDLLQSISGFDGEVIGANEQQDVEEFLNLFSSRLESNLKQTNDPKLIADIFGGQFSHVITCKKCQTTSERLEESRVLSLDINGHQTLESSLTSFIREEFLDGDNQYFCSTCNQKQDSIKRCCLNSCPDILTLHLKRFRFDLERWKKVKVNDRFEFPETLDVRPFIKDATHTDWKNLELESNCYSLQGVIIHSGTSESGHYYSLAKVQREGIDKYGVPTNLTNVKSGWYLFNDTITKPFDISLLEQEAFGGNNTRSNAYVLIYKKLDLNECQQIKIHGDQWTPDEIFEENRLRSQLRILCADSCEDFIIYLCTSEYSSPHLKNKAIRMLATYMIEINTLQYSKSSRRVHENLSKLRGLYERDTGGQASKDFLHMMSSSHRLFLEKILLRCDHKELRSEFKLLICLTYGQYNHDCTHIKEDDRHKDDENETVEFDCDDDVKVIQPDKTVIRLGRIQFWKSDELADLFKGVLIDFVDQCRPHWMRFESLFEVLDNFAKRSHRECLWMIRCGMILRLLHLYLHDTSAHVPQSSIPRSSEMKEKLVYDHSIGNRRKPNLSSVLSLLKTLVCSAQIPHDDMDEISDSSDSEDEEVIVLSDSPRLLSLSPYLTDQARDALADDVYFLPMRETRILQSRDFIQKLEIDLRNAIDVGSDEESAIITQMRNHLCYGKDLPVPSS